MNYLVETALLGHGLMSVKDDDILSLWPKGAMLAWVEKGKAVVGTIEEFIPARKECSRWKRLDGAKVRQGFGEDVNAYLTASGTMAVASEIGCPVVVTAGMGGIGDIKDERLCYDLPALSEMGITLVATSPKDMLDIPATLKWLSDNGVNTLGLDTDICNGYIMVLEENRLSGKISKHNANELEYGCNLVLNPIPQDLRFEDRHFLHEAVKAGRQAEKEGESFHPAVNACFDRMSNGKSSIIQLMSLIENIKVAQMITNRI